MRKTSAIAFTLLLAACGGSQETEQGNETIPTEVVNVVDETVPAEGVETTLPAAGSPAPGVNPSPEAVELVNAIKSVPDDKRRQLAALLECEEAKLPEGVQKPDRAAFLRKNLDALNVDPQAAAKCRAASQGAAPTE